ncbi:hypothetical protein HYH03_004648 [Edaphochlamys debaryana]|uniref:Uncharacterized protein n=1 Tax=Edaphochlamys debaryana TaxID=47281 RepID=A0A835YAZ4_9CHLO|nr:hypothetical protein HYH03_004648 [Edaphochlamys debaryana]|eukprot:KAG2497496.1 hypothetical protein HYH03_004648 [Edaphochlamys debaryana]
MQTGVQRALPSAAVLSALLPGLFVAQTRTKTYVSNVMNEERTKRITDHQNYWKARKKYRLELHDLFSKWRAELKAKQLAEEAVERQRKAEDARNQAERMAELLKEKRLASLSEQLRKAELEHKVAQVQVRAAERRDGELKRKEAARAARYQRLLEASRNWIRESEFEAAIHTALDNPRPFGFMANLQPSKGF